jgi:hypothetical protein
MRMRFTTFGLCLFLLLTSVSFAQTRMAQEYGDTSCEEEMAHLDNYAISLQVDPNLRGYIVVYGGRRGTRRRQMSARLYRIRRYLTTNRGIQARRIVTARGGFRERFTVELWLVPRGESIPATTSTVNPREVRFARTSRREDVCAIYF